MTTWGSTGARRHDKVEEDPPEEDDMLKNLVLERGEAKLLAKDSDGRKASLLGNRRINHRFGKLPPPLVEKGPIVPVDKGL
jgi:hypothetical protein